MVSPSLPVPPELAAGNLIAAAAGNLPEQEQALERARTFALPLIADELLESGEGKLAHADAVAAILKTIGGSAAMQAAIYLVHAGEHLNRPYESINKAFGEDFATLVLETTKLMRVHQQTRGANITARPQDEQALQTENVRKMLLGFSRDLRVVMLRLASRLQTLRYHAASKRAVSAALARE